MGFHEKQNQVGIIPRIARLNLIVFNQPLLYLIFTINENILIHV